MCRRVLPYPRSIRHNYNVVFKTLPTARDGHAFLVSRSVLRHSRVPGILGTREHGNPSIAGMRAHLCLLVLLLLPLLLLFLPLLLLLVFIVLILFFFLLLLLLVLLFILFLLILLMLLLLLLIFVLLLLILLLGLGE